MKSVFITGVTGFVGSNLVRYLNSQLDIRLIGHCRNVTLATRKFNGLRLELVEEFNAEVLDKLKVDCVIHLAGIAHDLTGQYSPQDYEDINHLMTVGIYNEFLHSKASSFIFVSSIKAAVDHTSIPATEQVIPTPVSDYGKSKRKAEIFIQNTPCPAGKRCYIFRPSMIFGPENKGNLNLLYGFVKAGIPYPLGAFKNQRSFLYVGNLNFIIERFIYNTFPSGIYHLADSESLSTVELVKTMAGIIKKRIFIWNFPQGVVNSVAFFCTLFRLPLNKQTLEKLTESLVVSNKKVIDVIGTQLPVRTEEGLRVTLNSFRG